MFNSAMISSAVQCVHRSAAVGTQRCRLSTSAGSSSPIFASPRTFFATEFSKNIDLPDQTHLEDGLKCKKNTLGLQFNAAEWLREYIGMHCLRLSSHCNSVCCGAFQNSGTSEGQRIADW